MKSVVESIGTENIIRVRVGIGKPDEYIDIVEHVIGAIGEEEKKLLEAGTLKAKKAVEEIIKNDVDSSMNKFNS